MRFALISEVETENGSKSREVRIPIVFACEFFGVSKSGYYAWRKRPESERTRQDRVLIEDLTATHDEHRQRLGIRRLTSELVDQGWSVSTRRVRRLARKEGLNCVHPKPWRNTTIPDGTGGLVDLVDRDFVPCGPNEIWFGDITYLHTSQGFAYLATVIDGYSRKVVGWAIATHYRTEMIIDALAMATANRRPVEGSVIFHSDRGSQYTSHAFRQYCLDHGILPSVGRTGICYDNAAAESFFATLKKELVNLFSWPTIADVRVAVIEYIEIYYNRKRKHSKIGNLTPVQYEQATQDHVLAA